MQEQSLKKEARDIQQIPTGRSVWQAYENRLEDDRKTNSDRSLYMDPMTSDKMLRYFEGIRKKERAYNLRNRHKSKRRHTPFFTPFGGLGAGALFKQIGLGKTA